LGFSLECAVTMISFKGQPSQEDFGSVPTDSYIILLCWLNSPMKMCKTYYSHFKLIQTCEILCSTTRPVMFLFGHFSEILAI